jgi:hypothetical protein
MIMKMAYVFAYSVCCTLEPAGIFISLFCCQDLDETAAETIEDISM